MWSTHCVAGRIGSAGAFNEKGCKAELIDGLYQIHRDQGIEVADQVSQKASKPWISALFTRPRRRTGTDVVLLVGQAEGVLPAAC